MTWLLQDPVDIHGLGHDASEILPHGARDGLALLSALLRESTLEIGQRAFVPPVIGGDQPPHLARDGASHVDREQPDDADEEPQHEIFRAVAQVA
jgi:hypothetical protein